MCDQIKFKSTCAMFCYYNSNSKPCLVLDPPILFGPQHNYHTHHCKDSRFANLETYRLSSTKKFFRLSATAWWNSLTVATWATFNYNEFTSSVKDLYFR